MKSFLEAMKCCINRQVNPEKFERKIEEFVNENTLTGTVNSNKNNLIERLSSIKMNQILYNSRSSNQIESIEDNPVCEIKHIKFENDEMLSPVMSPKLVKSRLVHLNTNSTVQSNGNIINLNVKMSYEDSPTKKGLKEDFFKARERENHAVLFTIKCATNDEMPEKVFCMNNIVILDSEIHQAKKLILEDEEGDMLGSNYLIIDASGLTNGLRKRRDGYVFFGPVSEYRDCIINDFVINFDNELCKTRLFVIFYERNEQKFFIRNINDSINNILMYVKINRGYQIKRKQYFSINQLALSIDPNAIDEDNKNHENFTSLKIILYNNTEGDDKEKEEKVFYFYPSDSPVTIGRSKCSITLDYSFLSKRHCEINYNREEEVWEINDGYKRNVSTNGIWMLLKTKYEVHETTHVKIGNNILKIGIH